MICSVPSAKSESSWLDRLRSSKGFPVGNGLDLEGFLNPNSDQALTSDAIVPDVVKEKDSPKLISDSAPLDTKSVAERRKNSVKSGFRKHRKKENLFNVMTNVLAELFNMGDQASLDGIRGSVQKKSSRKQPNPRLCLFSASANVDDGRSASLREADGVPAMSPSSADNSVTEVKHNEYSLVPKKRGKSASLTLAEEKSQMDPSSYSCVEVTIIDTSSSIWKSGKLIFRKGNIWKVRDKRWMSGNWTAFRKKRKASESDKKVGGKKKKKVGGKKKKKLSRPPLNTSKEGGLEELTNPFYEVHQNASEELCKETPDTGSQIPKKRSQFSRSPRKPANSNSPVFHVQGISAGMKEQGLQLPSSSNL